MRLLSSSRRPAPVLRTPASQSGDHPLGPTRVGLLPLVRVGLAAHVGVALAPEAAELLP